MVRIEEFMIERWMFAHESLGLLNIAETCAASISIDELTALHDGQGPRSPVIDTSTVLTYGAITGSETLRARVAKLCGNTFGQPSDVGDVHPDDVLITPGAISANFLAIYALVGPGDHVICVYPTYQQLYATPRSVGAEVSLWKLKKENGFVPDPRELEGLVRANTKMIIINNPNNPTGAVIPTSVLKEIISFAKARDIIVLSDEVYRPLFQDLYDAPSAVPLPALALGYDKVLATGSMSKAFALAGIRVGWVASRDPALVRAVEGARDYTTISVSQIDDRVASYALSEPVLPALLRRNVGLARTNLALLAAFVERHGAVCSWVLPQGGTCAFVQFRSGGEPVDDDAFCQDVIKKTGVFFPPGQVCFGNGEDFPGYVRIGYVCHTDVLKAALEKLDVYVKEHLVA